MSAGHIEHELTLAAPRRTEIRGADRGGNLFSRVRDRIGHPHAHGGVAQTLCEIGSPTIGRIIDKCVRVSHHSDGSAYNEHVLVYQFVPDFGTPVHAEQVIQRFQWDIVHVGDPMTVLYLPDDTRTNTLYRFGSCRCV